MAGINAGDVSSGRVIYGGGDTRTSRRCRAPKDGADETRGGTRDVEANAFISRRAFSSSTSIKVGYPRITWTKVSHAV